MRLQAGMKLAHYQILAPLGAGGMGEVYRARRCAARSRRGYQGAAGTPGEFAGGPLHDSSARPRLLAALSHPNLVAIFDVGTDQGICFAVMEFLAGETLVDLLAQSTLPLARVLEIGDGRG